MRVPRILVWACGLVAILVVALLAVPNTEAGRRLLARATAWATGDMVVFTGLSGQFPGHPRVAHLEIRDKNGIWLTIDGIELDWSPLRLLSREALIERLAAGRVALDRLPESSGSSGGTMTSLPVRVELQTLQVQRVEIAAPVAGRAAVLALDGRVSLASLQAGSGEVTIHRLDSPGDFSLLGRIDEGAIAASVKAREPAGGLASGIAGLPDLGALSLDLDVTGPWNAVAARLQLGAGVMQASAQGTIDLVGRTVTLDVAADAPAMRPRPDFAWRSASLRARVTGPFEKPAATGRLDLSDLEAGGASTRSITANLSGDATGDIAVAAEAAGLHIPGGQPDLFAAAPLRLSADIRLDTPDRPLRLSLSHPLLSLDGTLHVGTNRTADLILNIPEFAGFGIDLRGHASLHGSAAMSGDTTTLAVDGNISVDGGTDPAAALIGQDAAIEAEATLHGADLALRRLHVGGARISLDASGSLAAAMADIRTTLALPDLSVVAPALSGTLRADSHVTGPAGAMTVDSEVSGEFATSGFPRAPVTASLHADGLPGAASGRLTAQATLEGAALNIAAAAQRLADGTLHLAIDRADWKSLHVGGTATLAPGADVPQAHVVARMDRLAELRPLTGAELSGSFALDADIDAQAQARLRMEAKNIAGADSLRLQGTGKAEAMALQFDASGMGAAVNARATLNLPARQLALSQLQAAWKSERVASLAPATLSFADGLSLDRLRLGLRGGVLELAGRLSPTLDVTGSLRNLPVDLANVMMPDLGATGTVQGDFHLTGTTARPAGTIHLAGAGLRLQNGPAAALPPATLTADLRAAGSTGQLDARMSLGGSQITLAGTLPIDLGENANLRAGGRIDLALMDPILAAEARRLRGVVTLEAGITGKLAAPRVDGTLRLANGEAQDLAQGVRVHAVQALLRARGDMIRIEQFSGRAGDGTIGMEGSIGLAAPGPIELRITARGASPLASERLTVVLDADLTLRGALAGALTAAGSIKIQRADIRVPERLPTSVAVLNVRRPGEKPPPPPAPGPDIGLDLAIDAPSRIFLRGRGIDAELAGSLRIRGTAAAPRPEGSLTLRRGLISVVGTTLNFTSGTVGLDGSGRLDPTLDFKATTSSGGVLATLAVTGTASAPKLTLSSVPDLPQDEVLAHLLFGTSIAKLGPLQIAQIAAGLAELAGVGGGGGFQPLESIRKGLGLDRLSVGGGGDGKAGALEAGRYVAPGIYLGAKQGLSGTGTQATVQIDLFKGLKLETDVGTSSGSSGSTGASDSGGSKVGLTYQFDY